MRADRIYRGILTDKLKAVIAAEVVFVNKSECERFLIEGWKPLALHGKFLERHPKYSGKRCNFMQRHPKYLYQRYNFMQRHPKYLYQRCNFVQRHPKYLYQRCNFMQRHPKYLYQRCNFVQRIEAYYLWRCKLLQRINTYVWVLVLRFKEMKTAFKVNAPFGVVFNYVFFVCNL